MVLPWSGIVRRTSRRGRPDRKELAMIADALRMSWMAVLLLAVPCRTLLAQTVYLGPPEQHCIQNPTALSCLGQWSGPYDLMISTCPQPPDPNPYCSEAQYDDIGHAALIPVGPHAGEMLLWSERTYADGYTSHLWDPVGLTVSASPPFASGTDRPFCSGHAWVLDGGSPRFLAVGGVVPMSACTDCSNPLADPPDPPKECGSPQSYWFDPTTADVNTMWRRETPDLPEGAWYPSVIVHTGSDPFNPTTVPIAIGGSRTQGTCCESLWDRWYTLASPTAPAWTTHAGTIDCVDGAYSWHTYARTMLTTRNVIVGAGSFIDCVQGSFKPCYGYGNWGGNPLRLINVPPHPTPHDDREGPNPNDATSPIQEVGGWRQSHAAILHTLKPGVSFPLNPGDVAANVDAYYERDRVFVYGGAPSKGAPPLHITALKTTAELLDTHPTDPAGWTWQRKADAGVGRYNGNWTILPDGSILAVGGGNLVDIYSLNPLFEYHDSTERFWRGAPTDPGRWDVLAPRPPVADFGEATPRGYHSVGVLDASGAVWLIGGRRHVDPFGGGSTSKPDPEDTAEVYRPPYFFQGTRPGLGGVPSTVQYGVPFCVDTRDPSSLSHASLIGIGAVTHHFDYGQRYVELLIDVATENPCPQNTPVRILPPPMASMAPPGYYLLFLVDAEGRPSTGKFVLLTN
jgi:hypothetical protein